MPRTTTTCQTLTIGQLARRWGISRDHVRQIIQDGHLRGVFSIPSAGRYGAVVKIPLDSVLQAETENWAVTPKKGGRVRPRRSPQRDDPGPAFKHFPKLRATLGQPASGSDEAAQD
jgi:excisionase family DNA binding protein